MRRSPLALAAALVVVFLVPRARADEPAESAPQAAKEAPSADEVRAARAEIDGVLGEMSATSRRVRDQLRAARLRGTPAQIGCLDESLSRTDVALRAAKEDAGASIRAYAQGDAHAARDARRKMREWRDAQRVAAREGSSCAVSAIAVRSGTTVKVTVDPRIPRVTP